MFAPASRQVRILLFLLWLALILFVAVQHVPWRDEARAFAIAVAGSNWLDMLRALHGEGHPVLWYALLRGLHDLFAVKEVLTAAGVLVGIGFVGLFAFRSPFGPLVLTLFLFSSFAVFDHVVVARNYGLVGLLLFAIAALWPRVKNSLWLGFLLLLLCNTAVPAVLLAGGIMLYRLLQLWTDRAGEPRAHWLVFVGNGALLGVGALICFLTVHPTFNDAASVWGSRPFTLPDLMLAVINSERSFSFIGFPPPAAGLILYASLLVFIRNKPALIATLVVMLLMRCLFYFIYPAAYRHSALVIVFLFAMLWISRQDRPEADDDKALELAQAAGFGALLSLMIVQVLLTAGALNNVLRGVPMSQAANAARVIETHPRLKNAVLLGEPDTSMESVAYQLERPYWLLRQERFGTFTPLTLKRRRAETTLDDLLADAAKLHRSTGRPVAILLFTRDEWLDRRKTYFTMYYDRFSTTPEAAARFRQQTQRLASLPKALTNETYDIYVYPR